MFNWWRDYIVPKKRRMKDIEIDISEKDPGLEWVECVEEERKNELWENRELGADERYEKVSKEENEVKGKGWYVNGKLVSEKEWRETPYRPDNTETTTTTTHPKEARNSQVGGGHYTKMKIQPLEYSHANNLGPAEHTVVKYVSRWRDKGGLEDLRKAIHVIELLIEMEEKESLEKGDDRRETDERNVEE